MTRVTTVLGGGVTGVACALFAARHGPVRLCARRAQPARSVESVPAATMTLLLELGITPAELGVHRFTRERVVAWDSAEPAPQRGPSCAHLDRAALHAALWNRAELEPQVAVTARTTPTAPGRECIDATGRRAATATAVHRPPRTWTAATVTVRSTGFDGLRLAAAPDGYAYLVAAADTTTVGWVGPNRPPRDSAALRRRVEGAGAAWLLDGFDLPPAVPTSRRPAGLAIPVAGHGPVPIGDAALARDALASQGLSIGLSDACLAAEPATTASAMADRRVDGIGRHLRHLRQTVAACRFADAPVWAEYATWLGAVGQHFERSECVASTKA